MNKKTKNFSDLSKKQKDKIISDSCEGANEEQAELLNSVNDDWIKKIHRTRSRNWTQ